MAINVYEDQNTGEAVIKLGRQFDFNIRKEFYEAYSSFEPYRNFLIDFNAVETVDDSAFGMLLLLRKYAGGVESITTIFGCKENIAESLELPILHGLFEIR
jgi:anti-anti-sigma regulatory factor